MIYDVLDVCRLIVNYSNKNKYGITNLKLQKLLYFVQAYFLVSGDKERCFREEIEAWNLGPVVPKAYNAYKKFGANYIPTIVSRQIRNSIFKNEDQSRIEEIVDSFKGYTAGRLVTITHSQKPWIKAYNNSDRIITIESMRKYFDE